MPWISAGRTKCAARACHIHQCLLLVLLVVLLPGSASALKGHVTHHRHRQAGEEHGGQQPVTGSHLYLFAVNPAGYGAAPISLLHGPGVSFDASNNGYVVTDGGGGFNITGLYASYCPTPGSPVYLQALGGDPGDGSDNPAIDLVSILPLTCAQLPTAPDVGINELTTIAAAWTLVRYASPSTSGILANGGNPQALLNAVTYANNLVSGYNAQVGSTAYGGSLTVPVTTINTMGDIIAECVNTGAASPACTQLFAYATTSGSAPPTDTFQAAIDIALNPANNATNLFYLVPGIGAPFEPTLSVAPLSWTITYGIPASDGAQVNSVTFNHTQVPNTDQINFPVEVAAPANPVLATASNGGKVQSPNGYDILFTSDAAGQNMLDFEIDNYSPATGAGTFWVRVPDLSHTTDTVIYMWYGIPNISNSLENALGVWSNNYLSVYHFGNGNSLGTMDSAVAGYNLLGTAAPVQGQIGGAAAFDGDPYVYLYHDNVTAYPSGTSPVTLETWVQQTNSVSDAFGYGANTVNGSRIALAFSNGQPVFDFEIMGILGSGNANGGWHSAAGVYGGGMIRTPPDQIYLDGVSQQLEFGQSTPAIATTELKIGGIPTVTFCCAFTGSVDEARISSGVRSADWIATEFNNQSAPNSFGIFSPGLLWPASILLSSSANPSAFGQSVILTATVVGSNSGGSIPVPTGSVTFYDGINNLGPAVVISSGTATLSTSSLSVGSHSITAVYSGDSNYGGSTAAGVNQVVNALATPVLITWVAPSPITYGTPLSATQLDATATAPGTGASVAGIFSYSPLAGTMLSAGTQTLQVTFVPSNTSAFTQATASVTLTVNQATPTITWHPLTPVTSGTLLGASQLNAVANVPGTFSYFPIAGTVLSTGTQPIFTIFTPTDSTDYKVATYQNYLTVLPPTTQGQPSSSSGINPNDTYAVFDVAVQSTGGTYSYQTGSGPGSLPTGISFQHYHVEMGFDTSDNFVANITPTDPSGLSGFQAADFVSSIQIRGNTVTLLDGNGDPIQVQPLVPGAIIPGLIQAHATASQSLNAALAPQSVSAFAAAANGSLTQNGSSSAVSIQNANGISMLQYVTSGGNTTLASVTTTRTSQSFGSVTDTTTFSNMSAVTNPAGDARRAANAPPVAPTPSAPSTAPTCTVQDSSYPVIGPGAGTSLTMVHGLAGHGGLNGSFNQMEPWIAGAMQVGPIALPDVGWSNGLDTQVSNLESQLSGPSILIGHSQGGLVVRRLGQLRPDLTQGIVTIDTPHQGALIAFTGIAAPISGLGYFLASKCFSITHFAACALGTAILGASGFVTWDLTQPNWPDLYPGSSFLSTLNSSAEPSVTRVGIVSHSNPRFVALRVVGDTVCNPQDSCGGRAFYTTGQVVYYSTMASFFLDMAFMWLDPALAFDASISIDILMWMDISDLAWKILTAAPGDTDGLVPGSSQTYPNASATYTIANADSHPGNLKSTYVRDTLEDVLAQQFAIPGIGCKYALGINQYYPDPASTHIPFYGGADPIDASAYGVSNIDLCPIQGVSSVPFAQTGPLAVGALQYNYAVDFNFTNQPRYPEWNIEGQLAGAYQDPLPKPVALGSLMITGTEQSELENYPNASFLQYDYGTVTLTINNVAYSVPYAPSPGCNGDCPIMPTPASIMTALVNKINSGPQYVNAGFANCAITIAAWDPTVTTTDYNMSINIQSSLPTTVDGDYVPAFPNPSFYGQLSGPTLTGNP